MCGKSNSQVYLTLDTRIKLLYLIDMNIDEIIANVPKDKIFHKEPSGVIICADCLSILPLLPDKSVDLVLTSPPFNLGNNHHTGNIHHNPYNDDLPESDYQLQQIDILNKLYLTIKDEGSCWYQHKNRIKNGLMITPYEWLLKTKWLMKQEVNWFNGSQNFDKCRFYPMTERLYWLVQRDDTILCNILNLHDDWHIEPEGTDKLGAVLI